MNIEMQNRFFDEYKNRFSPDTVRCYDIALKQFFSFCLKDFDSVKARDIRAWLATMEEKGLKQRTIQLKLAALKSFYNYCMEENKIEKNPTTIIKTPKLDDSLPYYLSRRNLVLLQELTKSNNRDRAIVETLYTTGVRISELLNIKLSDVKWESRQIWIRKGKGTKERFVLFTHDCSERLKMYLDKRMIDSKFLFCNNYGKELSCSLIQKRFSKFSASLGFKVTPHTLRHTFAAHLAEKGMDKQYIQDLLGHVDINSTRIYTRLMEQAQKKLYDRYQ